MSTFFLVGNNFGSSEDSSTIEYTEHGPGDWLMRLCKDHKIAHLGTNPQNKLKSGVGEEIKVPYHWCSSHHKYRNRLVRAGSLHTRIVDLSLVKKAAESAR